MILPAMAPYLAPDVSGGASAQPTIDVLFPWRRHFELLSGRLPYYADTPIAMAPFSTPPPKRQASVP